MVSNQGACRTLGTSAEVVDLQDWQPGDRATLAGGLIIIGYCHGVCAAEPTHDPCTFLSSFLSFPLKL